MVLVNGRPFLEWLMDHLQLQGISKFVLCVGYLGTQIQDHFEDGKSFGCTIQYSVEKELLGTGGAIKKAFPLLDETFFVISGDNYLELNYRAMTESFMQKPALGMLACWNNKPPLFRSNIQLDLTSHQVQVYDYEDAHQKNYVDSGVKIFTQKLAEYFPEQDTFSLEIESLSKIARDGLLWGFPVAKPPLDVGTLEGLAEVRSTLIGSRA